MISLKLFFVLLVVLSLLVVLVMLFPDCGIMQSPLIFILWILHAFSGIGLVIMTYSRNVAGKAKTFLLAAGFSAVGFLAGVVLHNLLYALGTLTQKIVFLNMLLGFLEAGCFLLATILCPLGLFAGMVGTFIHWKQIN